MRMNQIPPLPDGTMDVRPLHRHVRLIYRGANEDNEESVQVVSNTYGADHWFLQAITC